MCTGQNVAGFTSIRARGPAGTRLFMRHAETLEAIPSAEVPSAVNNGYCNNNADQPGTPQDTGCTNCNSFVGAGANRSYSAVWGGNCANQVSNFFLLPLLFISRATPCLSPRGVAPAVLCPLRRVDFALITQALYATCAAMRESDQFVHPHRQWR